MGSEITSSSEGPKGKGKGSFDTTSGNQPEQPVSEVVSFVGMPRTPGSDSTVSYPVTFPERPALLRDPARATAHWDVQVTASQLKPSDTNAAQVSEDGGQLAPGENTCITPAKANKDQIVTDYSKKPEGSGTAVAPPDSRSKITSQDRLASSIDVGVARQRTADEVAAARAMVIEAGYDPSHRSPIQTHRAHRMAAQLTPPSELDLQHRGISIAPIREENPDTTRVIDATTPPTEPGNIHVPSINDNAEQPIFDPTASIKYAFQRREEFDGDKGQATSHEDPSSDGR